MKQKNNIPTIKCYYILALLALLLSGCKKHPIINQTQHILFQYEYLNVSDDHIHKGFYIDDKGSVFVYNNPEEWNFPAVNYYISEEQLADNLSKCTQTELKIMPEQLAKFSAHIKNISSSKITAVKKGNQDMWNAIFLCYNYSESAETYKGTVIKMEGSHSCENLNFFSKKISDWMKEVNNSISKK